MAKEPSPFVARMKSFQIGASQSSSSVPDTLKVIEFNLASNAGKLDKTEHPRSTDFVQRIRDYQISSAELPDARVLG